MATIHELKRQIAEKERLAAELDRATANYRRLAEEHSERAEANREEAGWLRNQLPPIPDRGRVSVRGGSQRLSGFVEVDGDVAEMAPFLAEAVPERDRDWFRIGKDGIEVRKPDGLYGAGSPGGDYLTETIKNKTQILRDKLKEILRDNGYKVR